MSEMVERVAMGIHLRRANSRHTKWEDCSEEYSNGTRKDARAAIEAMREPTDDMRVPESAKVIWRGMIDEALR